MQGCVRDQSKRRDRRECRRPEALLAPGEGAARAGDLLGRRAEPLVELRRDGLGAEPQVDLEEPLEAPRLEVARPGEQLLAVPDERLRVEHRRVLEDPHARVEQRAMVELLRRRARPVVRVRGHEEAHGDTAPRRLLDAPDHPAVGDVRVDDVEGLAGAVERRRDRVGDRPVAAGRVVEDGRGHRSATRLERREEAVELGRRHLAAQPAEAREEDELQLRDDGPGDAQEEVVKAPVVEVVLDPRPADPARAAVDDHELAVVDVPEGGEVPARVSAPTERPDRGPRLRGADDADLDPAGGETLVELPRALLRCRALPVDDQPDRHPLPRLRKQRLGERLADRPRPEAELVDVHRGRRRGDVGEHRGVEGASLDEDLRRRRDALLEAEREVGPGDRAGREPLRVVAEPVVRHERRHAYASKRSTRSP